jgi:hypothetical protein
MLYSFGFPVPITVTSECPCFEHNKVNTSGFEATHNHSLLRSCVQTVWFSSAILCEQVDGTVLTARNICSTHSSTKCVNCNGRDCLHTRCRLLTDLQSVNSLALNLPKYCFAVSLTLYVRTECIYSAASHASHPDGVLILRDFRKVLKWASTGDFEV